MSSSSSRSNVAEAVGTSQVAVRVVALGDLMLSRNWDSEAVIRAGLSDLARALAGDFVIANLETSVEAGEGRISKQPRVLASPETIRTAVNVLAVDVANLANNHIFDGNQSGFIAVGKVLAEEGVRHFGAGVSLDEASKPCVVEVAGLRLGFLGYVSSGTGISHSAAATEPGVNVLEEERALNDVRALRDQVDHVIVSLHWGVEYCDLPSPDQIAFARALVDCGARVIIGHHAHVIQGCERYRGGLIAYGVGNVTTTDHYIDGRRAIRQTSRTCSSYAIRTTLGRAGVESFETVALRCVGTTVKVADATAERYLRLANRRLARGVSPSRWRRRRLYEDVLLRTVRKLHPAAVASLRPQHFAKFFRNIYRAARGVGPAP